MREVKASVCLQECKCTEAFFVAPKKETEDGYMARLIVLIPEAYMIADTLKCSVMTQYTFPRALLGVMIFMVSSKTLFGVDIH